MRTLIISKLLFNLPLNVLKRILYSQFAFKLVQMNMRKHEMYSLCHQSQVKNELFISDHTLNWQIVG